jgi:hypothetical protein
VYYITEFKTTEPQTKRTVRMKVGIISPSKRELLLSLQEAFDAREVKIHGEYTEESAFAMNYLSARALSSINLN